MPNNESLNPITDLNFRISNWEEKIECEEPSAALLAEAANIIRELYRYKHTAEQPGDVERLRKAIYDASNSDEMISVDNAVEAAIAAMGEARYGESRPFLPPSPASDTITHCGSNAVPECESTHEATGCGSVGGSPSEISDIEREVVSKLAHILWKNIGVEQGAEKFCADKIYDAIRPYLRTTEPTGAVVDKDAVAKRLRAWLSEEFFTEADIYNLTNEIAECSAPKPVSVSLEKCAKALDYNAFACEGKEVEKPADKQRRSRAFKQAKDVLDAANEQGAGIVYAD